MFRIISIVLPCSARAFPAVSRRLKIPVGSNSPKIGSSRPQRKRRRTARRFPLPAIRIPGGIRFTGCRPRFWKFFRRMAFIPTCISGKTCWRKSPGFIPAGLVVSHDFQSARRRILHARISGHQLSGRNLAQWPEDRRQQASGWHVCRPRTECHPVDQARLAERARREGDARTADRGRGWRGTGGQLV